MKKAICNITREVLDCKNCKAPGIVGSDCPFWETDEHEERIAIFTTKYWEKMNEKRGTSSNKMAR